MTQLAIKTLRIILVLFLKLFHQEKIHEELLKLKINKLQLYELQIILATLCICYVLHKFKIKIFPNDSLQGMKLAEWTTISILIFSNVYDFGALHFKDFNINNISAIIISIMIVVFGEYVIKIFENWLS